MKLTELIYKQRLFFDGGTGTVLQSRGLRPGQRPEEWNLTHPEDILSLHRAYLDAGCNLIKTNTFGANTLRFGPDAPEVIRAGVRLARQAVQGRENAFVALDVGPCGKLLKPLGDLDFEDAVTLFRQAVEAGKEEADCILIETMNDAYETKAAVLGAKEACDLPIFVTNVYDAGGKLMTGADPKAMIAMLEGLGVSALGMNCSLGPRQMQALLSEFLEYASVPVIVNPNAGLPRSEGGRTIYDVDSEEFAACMEEMASLGASLLGGCCGTTPEYLEQTIWRTREIPLPEIKEKTHTLVSSYTHAVELGDPPTLIGERINPTGKPRLRQALREGDMDFILLQATEQAERGAHMLDVNAGVPGLNEAEVLTNTVCMLQEITDLPLQLDSSDPAALEQAMRRYNGKPLINSVNGKQESMAAVFPLVKKYGGAVIALTLNEQGIPGTGEGRLAIARRILQTAAEYGISKKNLIFDPLALTVSADDRAALVTLEAVDRLHRELGVRTSLGISNVSFGLPDRDRVTAAFFSMVLSRGLDAAILNPLSESVMAAYHTGLVLCGKDPNCQGYLAYAQDSGGQAPQKMPEFGLSLFAAIEKGLASPAAEAVKEELKKKAPLQLIDESIVPALDKVGKGFEEKRIYLPQLLMSAEAATAAFRVLRAAMPADAAAEKGQILLATVKGDIHDIGKNIVKVLLENYGYRVLDLGKDVSPEAVVEATRSHGITLVGLSALMTTTVPAMEETIRLLRKELPECRIMVGGAVLTKDYAAAIGADDYAADAMEGVRIANRHFQH